MRNHTTMTRQQFDFIAKVLSDLRRTIPSENDNDSAMLDRVTYRFAVALNATNETFDHARFIKAAGG